MTGYLHPGYIRSLAEFGSPRILSRSGGQLLERAIPGSEHFDGLGSYPIFACADWTGLSVDFEELQHRLVAVWVVTDPFGEYTPCDLKRYFPDLVLPYKKHFVTDLSCSPTDFVCAHHQRNIRASLLRLKVEECTRSVSVLDAWCDLYHNLVRRHGIQGLQAFSRTSFDQQLRLPGLVVLRAQSRRQTVGMLLWYVHGNVAYYHLGAFSDEGYTLGASFALFWHAITYFAQRGFRWLSLGAGAGVHSQAADGLTRFKKGWSTGSRTVYLCGRIFNRALYHRLSEAVRPSARDRVFPAYRAFDVGNSTVQSAQPPLWLRSPPASGFPLGIRETRELRRVMPGRVNT
jgi:hypothetical protein